MGLRTTVRNLQKYVLGCLVLKRAFAFYDLYSQKKLEDPFHTESINYAFAKNNYLPELK